MTQVLYWLEPNEKWRTRGYANNLILTINYDEKWYELRREMSFPNQGDYRIEVAKSGSIKGYIKHLEKNGFTSKI